MRFVTLFKKLQSSSLFRLLIGLLLLVVLFRMVGEREIISRLASLDIPYYLLGLGLYLLSLGLLGSQRLYAVLTSTGCRVKFSNVVATNFMGLFFASFMPQTVGIDLTRILELRRHGGNGSDVVASVFLDRIIGLISLLLMTFVAMLVGSQLIADGSVVVFVSVVALLFLLGWYILFNRPLLQRFRFLLTWPVIRNYEQKLVGIYRVLYKIRMQPGLIWRLIGICVVAQLLEVASVWALAAALDFNIAPFYFYIFVPIIWLITLLPISVGGLGVRESAYLFFFGGIGMAQADALTLSLLVYSCQLVMGIIGGFLFVLSASDRLGTKISAGVNEL